MRAAYTTLRLAACMVLIAPAGASHASGMMFGASRLWHKHNAILSGIKLLTIAMMAIEATSCSFRGYFYDSVYEQYE